MGRSVVALAVMVAQLAASASARGDDSLMDPAAKAHLDQGAAQFLAKRYDLAIVEFSAGYQIEPSLELLFGWAQAERLRGNCAAAVRLYKGVVTGDRSSPRAALARWHLASCEKLLPRPWYKNAAGDALALTGVAALGVGAGLFVTSQDAERETFTAANYADYATAFDDGSRQRIGGIVMLSLGAALTVGGVTAYLVGRRARGLSVPKR